MLRQINKRKSELNPTVKNIISFIKSSFLGTIICLILTLLFSIILSNRAVLNSSTIINIFFIISVLVGALLNGLISSKSSQLKGIISGAISSILYSLIIIILMLIFTKNSLNSYFVFLVIGIVIFSSIGGILAANFKRKR